MHYSLIVFLSVIVVCSCGSSKQQIEFDVCEPKPYVGPQSGCTINDLYVMQCPIKDSNGTCIVRMGWNVTVVVNYTPNFTCKELLVKYYTTFEGRESGGIPYYDISEACPLQPGRMTTYYHHPTIYKYQLGGIYHYKLEIWNEKHEECCVKYKLHHV